MAVFVLGRLARVRARQRDERTPSELAARQVLELPLSSALVLSLLATRWIYPQTPRAVLNVVGLLVLVPAVLIVRRLASPSVAPAIYALGAFFLADRVREAAWGLPVFEQWLFLLEMVFGIGFLSLALRSVRLWSDRGGEAALPWSRGVRWLLGGQRGALACAVAVGTFGFMRFARLLGGGSLSVAMSHFSSTRPFGLLRGWWRSCSARLPSDGSSWCSGIGISCSIASIWSCAGSPLVRGRM